MDFLKLLRSLEEFLYELCTWFLFFPRTLYRVIVHPRRMAQYVNTELTQKLDNQFDDAISPPMFLMLAVLVAHGVELLMHQQVTGTGSCRARCSATRKACCCIARSPLRCGR